MFSCGQKIKKTKNQLIGRDIENYYINLVLETGIKHANCKKTYKNKVNIVYSIENFFSKYEQLQEITTENEVLLPIYVKQ